MLFEKDREKKEEMMALYEESGMANDTRMSIVRAIVELGRHDGVATLATRAVCEHVGVSRQAFYYHFRDKYDAIQWYNRLIFKELAEHVGRDMLWSEAGSLMAVRTAAESDFYAVALRTDEDYNSLRFEAARSLYESWKATVLSYEDFVYTDHFDMLLRYFPQLGVTIIADWVRGGCAQSLGAMDRVFATFLPEEVREIMDAHVEARRKRPSVFSGEP